ncbi:MAG TPA: RNA polymerase sigma factor, partial [Candidatus Limnocylindrales bacterium]|nr:RNA polymerase sigma factor [Candidatus Limnocylindrales bacterium]
RQLDLDRPLVEAARRDRREFDALYRKYVAQVYAFAFYELRDHHAAEDATEATFLRALVALPRFEERPRPGRRGGDDASTFRVWLFRIARNVIANERRRVRRHPAVPLDPEDAAGLGTTNGTALDEAAIRRDDADAAWAAVARLPDDRRRAVTLRFLHEMTTREIAAVLGRSEGAVRVLIHRALGSVARDLGDERS